MGRAQVRLVPRPSLIDNPICTHARALPNVVSSEWSATRSKQLGALRCANRSIRQGEASRSKLVAQFQAQAVFSCYGSEDEEDVAVEEAVQDDGPSGEVRHTVCSHDRRLWRRRQTTRTSRKTMHNRERLVNRNFHYGIRLMYGFVRVRVYRCAGSGARRSSDVETCNVV